MQNRIRRGRPCVCPILRLPYFASNLRLIGLAGGRPVRFIAGQTRGLPLHFSFNIFQFFGFRDTLFTETYIAPDLVFKGKGGVSGSCFKRL